MMEGKNHKTMYYCEKCHLITEKEICDCCANKDLREVADDDYCFLCEFEEAIGKMFSEILKNEGIYSVMEPIGSGVRSNFGLSLGRYAIYVPYRFYFQAEELLEYFQDDVSFSENLKKDILENVEKWTFETKTTEKKIRKKYKLDKETDVMNFVKEIVERAESIEAVGLMSYGENGLIVKSGEVKIWFSSQTYKISI